jgi:hypothetical protein
MPDREGLYSRQAEETISGDATVKQLIANQVAIMKALQLLLARDMYPTGSITERTMDELTRRILDGEVPT